MAGSKKGVMGCGHCARCVTGQANLGQTGYGEVGLTRGGPGQRVLVIGAGTGTRLAVTLVRLWSPARWSCRAAAPPGRSAFRSVVTLLNAGQFAPGFLVTHRYPRADWRPAAEVLRHGDGPRGEVLLTLAP